MGYGPSLQDPLSLLPILGLVFVLGLIWLAVMRTLKFTFKVFAFGCMTIVLFGFLLALFGGSFFS
jgi:hypothetical protein